MLTVERCERYECDLSDKRGLHVSVVPLEFPVRWALSLSDEEQSCHVLLSGEHIQTLYQLLHIRLIVAPRADRAAKRAMRAAAAAR